MADKPIVKLKGHEKFSVREGWITKGLFATQNDIKIFNKDNAPDVLGVGTNMVKSIRYWMQAFELIVKDKNNEKLSDLANVIIDKDPYIEDVFTLWILHSHIAKNKNISTFWYMFFNRFNVEEFTKAEAKSYIYKELISYAGQVVNESSASDDLDVLLNMYSRKNTLFEDPEDKNISSFSALGLIKNAGDRYVKQQPDLRILSDYVILYELSSILKDKAEISIDAVASGVGSIGSIYNLSRVSVNMYLDKLEAKGYIHVNRTAGLDMIYAVNMPSPIDVLNEYYNG